MPIETGYSGLSFPPRIGAKGGWVLSTTSQVDVAHIKESIQTIIGTYVGERVAEPTFGSEVHEVIFLSMDATLANLLRFKINEALVKWEPRIRVTNVAVNWIDQTGHEQEGTVFATIDFTVLRTQIDDSVTVVLRREVA
jgi:hypothetical protein